MRGVRAFADGLFRVTSPAYIPFKFDTMEAAQSARNRMPSKSLVPFQIARGTYGVRSRVRAGCAASRVTVFPSQRLAAAFCRSGRRQPMPPPTPGPDPPGPHSPGPDPPGRAPPAPEPSELHTIAIPNPIVEPACFVICDLNEFGRW